MPLNWQTIDGFCREVQSAIESGLTFAYQTAIGVAGWAYFPYVAFGAAVVIAIVLVCRPYVAWRSGWLSGLIDDELRRMRQKHKEKFWRAFRQRLPTPKYFAGYVPHICFTAMHATASYFSRHIWRTLRNYYLPSVVSVVIALTALAAVMFLPTAPTVGEMNTDPRLHALEIQAGVEKVIEGLIVVIIALIVFVAESIRTSQTSDEKRVLLRISNLWPLILGITLLPLAFLYPPGSRWNVALVILLALFTIYTFGRVLISLTSASANAVAQRKFFRERVGAIVTESARQRIGTRILFEKLGPDREIKIKPTISRGWLPGRPSQFVFVDAPSGGTLADINLAELKKLGALFEQRARELKPVSLPRADEGVAEAAPGSPQAREEPLETGAYLVRRFQEEIPRRDNIFARDNSVIAIRKTFAEGQDLVDDVRSKLPRIFKFSSAESPSFAFRQEMQATKDRLIAALRSGALGEIDDLREIYLIVAEEFLITLNRLGGGYSAEQAREERNNFSEGWTELRWLRDDVRDLIVVAAGTDNQDVIGKIAYLPFAIATRAFTANDQLLFQEFMSFSSFIYVRGEAKVSGDDATDAAKQAGQFMISRSWQHVREILQYYIGPRFTDEDDDDD